MFEVIKTWFRQYFSDPEAVVLFFTLLISLFLIVVLGHMLAPAIVAVIFAYLFNGLVSKLDRCKCPHLLSVVLAFLLFAGAVLIIVLFLLPLLWQQLINLINEMPHLLDRGQSFLMQLPKRYPHYISPDQIHQILSDINQDITKGGKLLVAMSLASIPGLIELIVYLVLVPFLVFFFLKDSSLIFAWLGKYLPKRRSLTHHVWSEVYLQIGHYVRGRIIEIIIVTLVATIIFSLLGLHYPVLLASMVGLSVIVPYIGVVIVTIPVIVIAFLQWGWTAHFAYLTVAYSVLIALEGNVLVPLLFAETMNIHPVAIIVAVLFFGGLWGFWGIFFAIPLATVVNAVLRSWPTVKVSA